MKKMKLYEFNALIRCSVVIAAKSEKEAREEIKTYERSWFETGDFIEVCTGDIELVDVRKSESDNLDDLSDEAHVIVN
jgi:hypothetical protein